MQWRNIEQQIASITGKAFKVVNDGGVGGGCINTAYKITGQDQREYFVKFNRADKLDMFEAEADGLRELANAQAVLVPEPVATGIEGSQAYIILEYLPFGGGDAGAMRHFGEQLAQLHRYTKEQYGWHRDNTIGATHQPNHWENDWPRFWRKHRLGFQLELAGRNGLSSRALKKGERLLDQLESFFTDYTPEASLLHGDLWGGNYAVTFTGEPVIFDPAVYFGDREADIAMTELFGGFGRDFYAAYNSAWPLDDGYEIRKTFYNLYHILNHYNLFGGGYGSQAEGMTDRLLAEIG
jgi:fructosamine-3-kinase